MRNNIPKGWLMKRFGEVFEFLSTLSLSRSELTYEKTIDEIYNIHYGDIHSKFEFQVLDLTKAKELPKIINNKGNNYTFLKEGDLIIADASEDYAGVASCIELKNVNNKKITAGLHTFAARDNSNLTVNGFRAYILKNDWVFNEVKKLATGSKVYGVSKTNIQNLKILLPPLREQEKIAEILSKWDELIATQSQLIQAKQKQKKALMQKLLSGKLRFPGFTDKWEEKTLGSVAEVIMGQSPDSNSYNNLQNGLPLIQGNADIKNRVSCPKLFTSNPTKITKKGDLLMTVRAPVGSIGKSSLQACIGRGVCAIRPNNVNSDFLYYSLIDYEDKWKSLEQGSTFSSVNSNDIKSLKIMTPNNNKEQQKIASVLSACEEEIETLKTELQSLQNQKKGLMQQLLTGKIKVNW